MSSSPESILSFKFSGLLIQFIKQGWRRNYLVLKTIFSHATWIICNSCYFSLLAQLELKWSHIPCVCGVVAAVVVSVACQLFRSFVCNTKRPSVKQSMQRKWVQNLADLPLDLPADLPPQYWHLMVKMSSYLADLPLALLADLTPMVLTSHGQDEFKFGRSASRSTPPVLISCGQDEFKFGRSTPRSAGRSTPQKQQLQCIMG